MAFFDPGKMQFPPLNYCAYCGSKKDLRREHIVPYSFGGRWVLPKASCGTCADVTKSFEGKCARGLYGNHRQQVGFPSRHKHEWPTHFPVTLHAKEGERRDLYRVDDVPLFPVALPIFNEPRILHHLPSEEKIGHTIWTWIPDYRQQDQFEKVSSIHQKSGGHFSLRVQVVARPIMRMMAKIAHAAAIARYGSLVRHQILPPYILGTNRCITDVVGSWRRGPIAKAEPRRGFWAIEFGRYIRRDRTFVTAKIEILRHLYAGQPANSCPPFFVVVGECNLELEQAMMRSGDKQTSASEN